MIARRCTSMPLVEARRDGRLDARERASVERHLEGCASCRALDADLGRLADLSRAPLRPVSKLEHVRGRMRLLQDAAAVDVPPPGEADRGTLGGVSATSSPARTGWRAPLAVAATVLLLVVAGAGRSGSNAASSSAPQPIAVAPQPIAVAPQPISTATQPISTAPQPIDAPAATTRVEEVASSARPAPASAKKAASPRKPVTEPAPAATSDELAAGVGSLARGDFGEAAARLQDFEERHPGDARAEDAAFLRVIALDRAGKREAAAEAARAYLARYPDGYRRREAAAIAARPD